VFDSGSRGGTGYWKSFHRECGAVFVIYSVRKSRKAEGIRAWTMIPASYRVRISADVTAKIWFESCPAHNSDRSMISNSFWLLCALSKVESWSNWGSKLVLLSENQLILVRVLFLVILVIPTARTSMWVRISYVQTINIETYHSIISLKNALADKENSTPIMHLIWTSSQPSQFGAESDSESSSWL